jgi:hypothetical protein
VYNLYRTIVGAKDEIISVMRNTNTSLVRRRANSIIVRRNILTPTEAEGDFFQHKVALLLWGLIRLRYFYGTT